MPPKLKLGDKIKKFFATVGKPETSSKYPQAPTFNVNHLLPGNPEGELPDKPTRPRAAAVNQLKSSEPGGREYSSLSDRAGSGSHLGSVGPAVPDDGSTPPAALQGEAPLPQVLAALQSGSAEQRAAAAEALFNFTAESEAARQAATAAGAIHPLVELLGSGTDNAKIYAAYTLSSLTSIDESLEQMRAAGAIPALIGVLEHSPLLVCKKGAMRALGRLARNDDAAADIVAAGGLPHILSLLNRRDSSLLRRCLIALYFIGADKDALQLAIGRAGAIPQLLQICRSDVPEIQAEAIDVIKVMCRNGYCAREIAAGGGLELLLSVSRGGSTARSRASAARALQRLQEVPELREAVAALGVIGGSSSNGTLEQMPSGEETEVHQLVEVVQKGSTWVKAKAAAVIEQAAAEDPLASRDLAACGVLEPLLDLLEKGTEQSRTAAARAISRMADEATVLERLSDRAAVGKLLRAVVELRGSGQEMLAVALERLAQRPAGASSLLQEGAPARLLYLLASSSKHGIQAAAAAALVHLAKLDVAAVGEQGGVTVLMDRLSHVSDPAKCSILLLIAQLAARPKLQQELTARGAVQLLGRIARSQSQPQLADLSARVLDQLQLSGLEDGAEAAGAAGSSGAVGEQATTNVVAQQRDGAASPSTMRPPSPLPLQQLQRPDAAAPRPSTLSVGSYTSEAASSSSHGTARQQQLHSNSQQQPPHDDSSRLPEGPAESSAGGGGGGGGGSVNAYQRSASNRSPVATASPSRLPRPAPEPLELQLASPRQRGSSCAADIAGGRSPDANASSPRAGSAPGAGAVRRASSRIAAYASSLSNPGAKEQGGGRANGSRPAAPSLIGAAKGTRPASASAKAADPLSVTAGAGRPASARLEAEAPPSPSDHAGSKGGLLPRVGRGSSSRLAVPPGQLKPATGSKRNLNPHSAEGIDSDDVAQQAAALSAVLEDSLPGDRHARKDGGEPSSSNPSAVSDDLLSSTYDNLHGLLMKRSDIELCRNGDGKKCRLGEGGFGVVYKALMNGVDEVAVKLVKNDNPSRKDLELFLKEVQTLAKLHHRNIVQFYGACLEQVSMFFVTELMKGGDLYSALRHHPDTMRWDRLGKKVALDVALGLNYLHSQRPPMMHRDLKSPNVLLSEEGVAKIADVGMVRAQVQDLVTAQPVMTPLWAAPEVVRHERASIKADIWSYGILIWELVSGEDITEFQPLAISRQVGASSNSSSGGGRTLLLPARAPTGCTTAVHSLHAHGCRAATAGASTRGVAAQRRQMTARSNSVEQLIS